MRALLICCESTANLPCKHCIYIGNQVLSLDGNNLSRYILTFFQTQIKLVPWPQSCRGRHLKDYASYFGLNKKQSMQKSPSLCRIWALVFRMWFKIWLLEPQRYLPIWSLCLKINGHRLSIICTFKKCILNLNFWKSSIWFSTISVKNKNSWASIFYQVHLCGRRAHDEYFRK